LGENSLGMGMGMGMGGGEDVLSGLGLGLTGLDTSGDHEWLGSGGNSGAIRGLSQHQQHQQLSSNSSTTVESVEKSSPTAASRFALSGTAGSYLPSTLDSVASSAASTSPMHTFGGPPGLYGSGGARAGSTLTPDDDPLLPATSQHSSTRTPGTKTSGCSDISEPNGLADGADGAAAATQVARASNKGEEDDGFGVSFTHPSLDRWMIKAWLPLVFDGFEYDLIDSFVNRLRDDGGFVTVQDLLDAQSRGELTRQNLADIAGFKIGHCNRLDRALAEYSRKQGRGPAGSAGAEAAAEDGGAGGGSRMRALVVEKPLL
jgi:hypothetical protein